MPDKNYLKNLRVPTKETPLRILVSTCMIGIKCGIDGTAYGEYPSVLKLMNYDNVILISFCPEDFSFGTPREMCDIHGGTGFDVLNGTAKVLTETGKDWTEGMIKASEKMLEVNVGFCSITFLKILLFHKLALINLNTAFVISYYIIIKIFWFSGEEFDEFGKYTIPMLIILSNILFLLTDFILSVLSELYKKRIKKHIGRIFK